MLFALPIFAITIMSWSGGYTGASVTGSPGDGSTCSNCHGGGSFATTGTITTNIPVAGYALNTTYTVTVSFTGGVGAKRGFQLTAEKAGGTKVGTFMAGSGSQVFNSQKTVSHSSNTVTSWSFSWTSPSADQGAVTFYAALNAANGDGGTNGDKVITLSTTVNVLGTDSFFAKQFNVYPNPASDMVTIKMPENITTATVTIFDFVGKQVAKTNLTSTENSLDISNLPTGTYLVSIATEYGIAKKQLVIKGTSKN